MWSRFKGWVIAAGVVAVAVFWAIVQVFNAGKKDAQADAIRAGQKEEDSHRANLDKADAARNEHNRTGGVPIDSDPNNRANRRDGPI